MDSSSPVALPSAVTTEIRAATFLRTTWQNLELQPYRKGSHFEHGSWLSPSGYENCKGAY